MKADFFKSNREKLAKSTGLVVLAGYTQMQRSNDAAFLFEQEANFWYLTGIEYPDWRLVSEGSTGSTWLISPEVDPVHDLFDGSLKPDEAKKLSGVDKVLSHDEGNVLLRQLAKKHSIVYTVEQPKYVQQSNFFTNPSLLANKRELERIFTNVGSCEKELALIRAIKSEEEIQLIQKAIDLTNGAFEVVKKKMSTYRHEYEIEADFTYCFRSVGARGHAYDPIIASDSNACTLHYASNNSLLKKNALVLMDVGVRYGGYAADITRTYAKGRLTKRQEDIHRALQEAQHNIITLLEPGLSVQTYASSVDQIMSKALVDLKLIRDENDREGLQKYFPHAISHGLGIDVHDSLGAPREFQPGMVLTVEPGVYIPEENIGVRIEDDILITPGGHRNLSARLSTEW